MATIIGTLIIKGNDIGNIPSYNEGSIYTSNNQIASGGAGGFTPGTLVQVLDQYIANLSGYTGTFSYTLNGPGVWNGGTDTTVTITYTDMLLIGLPVIPYYFILTTEDYTYATVFESEVTPTLCNECQFIQLTQCGDENFRLDLGLADGNYTAFYADNTSGVIWEQGTSSTDALGGLLVYQWQATAGMFNQFSFYTLTINDANGDAVSWTIDDIEYTCATLTFRTTVNITD